jgi:hypothetical protein
VVGVEETVRYTYRLRPGAQAERALMAEWHRCRWLWNEAVHQRRIGHKPNRATVAKMLTAARKTSTWLREGSQNAQACMLETWALANTHSYQVRGRAKPAIKKKHKTLPSLGYNRNGFSIRDGRLRLPKRPHHHRHRHTPMGRNELLHVELGGGQMFEPRLKLTGSTQRPRHRVHRPGEPTELHVGHTP